VSPADTLKALADEADQLTLDATIARAVQNFGDPKAKARTMAAVMTRLARIGRYAEALAQDHITGEISV
jgi:hypothetical protein